MGQMGKTELHLAMGDLTAWSRLTLAEQARHAYHLSRGCEACWEVLGWTAPAEPLRQSEPFLRALARIRHPKVDLSLTGRAIRPFLHLPFRPDDFPTLLLQESVAIGMESSEDVAKVLALPFALAQLLTEWASTRPEGTDLKVNTYCAAVDLHLAKGNTAAAASALESASGHYKKFCDPSTEVNLMVADFKVACWIVRAESRKKPRAIERYAQITEQGLQMIFGDPVRQFEIMFEACRWLHSIDVDNKFDADWIVTPLEAGPWANEVHRLNGLFHKARFALLARTQLPRLPRSTASELENSLPSIDLYGDYFSLGRYHQLLGELRSAPECLEQALKTYETLELAGPFLETWKVLDKLDTHSRSRISDRAYDTFGKEAAHRMAREVSGTPDPAEALA